VSFCADEADDPASGHPARLGARFRLHSSRRHSVSGRSRSRRAGGLDLGNDARRLLRPQRPRLPASRAPARSTLTQGRVIRRNRLGGSLQSPWAAERANRERGRRLKRVGVMRSCPAGSRIRRLRLVSDDGFQTRFSSICARAMAFSSGIRPMTKWVRPLRDHQASDRSPRRSERVGASGARLARMQSKTGAPEGST
jgi:hypothetical protein